MTTNLTLFFAFPDCHSLTVPTASLNAVSRRKRPQNKIATPIPGWSGNTTSCSGSLSSSSYYGPFKRFCNLPSSHDLCALHKSSNGGNINDDKVDGVPFEEVEPSIVRTMDSEDLLCENGITIQVIKLERRLRRIKSSVEIDASLHTVWELLTDYERLADFIPGLAVSQLLEKTEHYARLFQIGQQNLAFGLKFNAKGIIDCYEKELETLSFGHRREIDFKMVEGDFLTFEGKWSIEQHDRPTYEASNSSQYPQYHTILYYVVDVEPKRWLPVSLVEGRLCKEVRTNLSCIREAAHRLNLQILAPS